MFSGLLKTTGFLTTHIGDTCKKKIEFMKVNLTLSIIFVFLNGNYNWGKLRKLKYKFIVSKVKIQPTYGGG